MDICFNELPNNSFNVVFPQLPVIAIIFVFIFSLYSSELLVNNLRESLLLIWREIFNFFSILLTTTTDAFFLKASLIYLLPSFFFPLIAKKISFFFISFELILAFCKEIWLDIFFSALSSLSILTFKLFDNFKFLIFIASSIIFLSEKKIFLTPISWIFSWPFPATSKISPVFKFFIASLIALALLEYSNTFCFFIPFLMSFLILLGCSSLGLSSVR